MRACMQIARRSPATHPTMDRTGHCRALLPTVRAQEPVRFNRLVAVWTNRLFYGHVKMDYPNQSSVSAR